MRAQSFVAAALFIVVLSLSVIPNQADAADKMLYWNDGYNINRANLDGTGIQQLVSTGGNSWGLAINSAAGKMYWTEGWNSSAGKIRRSNLDGSQAEDIFTGLTGPLGLALDSVNERIYWSDGGSIKWSNLDGLNTHTILNAYERSYLDIALDPTAGKIYWTDRSNNVIQRSNLDGSQAEDVIYCVPMCLSVDAIDGKIFWTDDLTFTVGWANLDGSDMHVLPSLYNDWSAYGITFDHDADKIYWSGGSNIRRANLDGFGAEIIVSDTFATSIVLGPVPEPASALLIGAGLFFARLRHRQS